MSREYNLYLHDILEAIRRIDRYTRGMDYEEFLADDLVQDGVIRNLMVSPGEPLCPSKD
ncbi:HepT-like ribonuclease domain-containing protein [Methanoculleus horonobensis]|nr:HepT-like ribonuclease domain-containing protein [Methanoculleus horonobensis]